jgi:hypothetical protein
MTLRNNRTKGFDTPQSLWQGTLIRRKAARCGQRDDNVGHDADNGYRN